MGFAGGVGRHSKHPPNVRPELILLVAHPQDGQFLFIEDLERFGHKLQFRGILQNRHGIGGVGLLDPLDFGMLDFGVAFAFAFAFILYSPAASTTDKLSYRFDGFIS